MRNPVRDLPHYFKVFQKYLGSRIYLIFALTLFAVLAEGFGILMVLPLLEILDSGARTSSSDTSGLIAYLQNLLTYFGVYGSAIGIIIFITCAFLLKGILTFVAQGFNAYLRGQLLFELKSRLFEQYSRMSFAYYSNRDTGHFINAINEQTTLMVLAFQNFTRFGSQIVNTLIYLSLAFAVAWRFGLMALVLGVSVLFFFRWLNVYVRSLSRKAARENGALSKMLIQALHAFKYLVATGQMPGVKKKVGRSIYRLTKYEKRRGIASAFTESIREPFAVVFIMAIVLVQLALLKQPLAPMLVSILLFYRAFNSIMTLQGNLQLVLERIGSLEMVRDEFESQQANAEQQGQLAIQDLDTGISFRNVSFSYDPAQDDVLRNVSLEIPVRQSVAFVGESGAGKSTLVDLITLMLKPHTGEVLIDGVPGGEIKLESWRRQIGYVSQETVIFDDTIANNICLWQGHPNQEAGLMGQIQEVAAQANLGDFIETLPDGYNTLVGDRGIRLSGGQRQRLFIARELFRKPNLLILDEATSALDSESERAIQDSIDNLKGHITVVIIAHRLSTIRNVDRVYVLDKGRVVEQGTYEELRDAEDSRFAQLASLQAL